MGGLHSRSFHYYLNSSHRCVMEPAQGTVKATGSCRFCGAQASLRCSRCKDVYYCRKEHIVSVSIFPNESSDCEVQSNIKMCRTGNVTSDSASRPKASNPVPS